MFDRDRCVEAFSYLRDKMLSWLDGAHADDAWGRRFNEVIRVSEQENPWFTSDNVVLAVKNLTIMLQDDALHEWLGHYPDRASAPAKVVGVVMAGNIPMVGFHDFMCVLMSGNRFIGKLAHDDRHFLPFLADTLVEAMPELQDYISFTTERLAGFDAIIATGSNNSSRYFDFYFGRYPNLIRRNRNGVAVIKGDEQNDALRRLCSDIVQYFGLGCRSVSMLFVPQRYDFTPLLDVLSECNTMLSDNHRYYNNYKYYRTINLLDQRPHFDTGAMIVREEASFQSPVAVLHYQYYNSIEQLTALLDENADEVQCIVSDKAFFEGSFDFGNAQKPRVCDYADGVDTMEFLLSLK